MRRATAYCSAILESALTGLKNGGHDVDLIHLDKDGFNPVMTACDLEGYSKGISSDPKVLEYQDKMKDAGHIIFIFPIWWELMPALTKGFIDKVLTKGFAYDCVLNRRLPKFANKLRYLKGVTVITTMDTPSIVYRLVFGNAIKKSLLVGTFWKIGVKNTRWISFNMVKSSSVAKRKRWLTRIGKYCSRLA